MPRKGAESRRAADIPFVSFLKKTEIGLEFEVVSLGKLFRRKFRRPQDEPQRLGFYQAFWATRGEGLYTVDFKTHAFMPGDCVSSAPGQVQRFQPTPEVDGVMLVFIRNCSSSFYDRYRVEKGKIAEHRDTIEAIPTRGE